MGAVGVPRGERGGVAVREGQLVDPPATTAAVRVTGAVAATFIGWLPKA
jgi:hypothetical protein